MTSASIRAFAATRLHVLSDHLLYGVLLGLDGLLFEVDAFLLIGVVRLLLLWFLGLPIFLLHFRLVAENSSLLRAVFECLLVNWFILLLEWYHFSIDDRIVLQRHGSLLGILNIYLLLLDATDPLSEF